MSWLFKKKEVNVEPDGYLGELSDRQQKCFDDFKAAMQSKNILDNPWFTDTFLLKFCRARNFDFDKVMTMFENYLTYRE